MAYRFTLEHPALEYELKKLIIREAERDDWTPEDLSDTEALFGEHSRIALDSLPDEQTIARGMQAASTAAAAKAHGSKYIVKRMDVFDSLDALQICVALQSHFGVRLNGDRMVRRHMTDVAALAAFVRAERQGA